MRANQSSDIRIRDSSLKLRVFGRSEIKELRRIVNESEEIKHCTYGFYQGGSGVLVATNERLILLDKRPFYLNIEEISYESIKDVVFSSQILQATLHLHAGLRKLTFRSISDARLRAIKNYVHERIAVVHELEQVFEGVDSKDKPYLNPAWRPHHVTLLRRSNPTKFYGDNTNKL